MCARARALSRVRVIGTHVSKYLSVSSLEFRWTRSRDTTNEQLGAVAGTLSQHHDHRAENMMAVRFFTIAVVIMTHTAVQLATAASDGLGRLPMRGWDSWNWVGTAGCDDKCAAAGMDGRCHSEVVIRGMADALKENGYAEMGYDIVTMSEGWPAECFRQGTCPGRFPNNTIRHDPDRYPSGIKALADYVHAQVRGWGAQNKKPGSCCCNSCSWELLRAQSINRRMCCCVGGWNPQRLRVCGWCVCLCVCLVCVLSVCVLCVLSVCVCVCVCA